jgi:glycosyltransferase involved in cell wall biosynthesis
MKTWHIITCEYPPQPGGVSDYTYLLADHLRAAGDATEVYAPAGGSAEELHVHRTLGGFTTADLGRTAAALDQFPAPRRLLLQWVPHGYGRRAMNLEFCRWIASRTQQGDLLYLMVHEPYLEYSGGLKQSLASFIQRKMIRTLLAASTRAFVSIPAWERYLRPYSSEQTDFVWLPIPSTIPVDRNAAATASIRTRFVRDALIVGHLGTYSEAITTLLTPTVLKLLERNPNAQILLLGKNSHLFATELRARATRLAARIHGTGLLDARALSHCISVCDLMLQPFPDGLSSRRTSLMNVLSHGIAVVSNSGRLTEDLWSQSAAVALADAKDSGEFADLCFRLLRDHASRNALADAGLELYRAHFDWPNVIAALRSSPEHASEIRE